MADERTELTEVQAILTGLTTPTDEQFVQAVRGYSDGAVASAAAKRGLGGGAGLPAWWTVDSTPGSESVEFNGETIGGTFNYAQRAAYSGNAVSVANTNDELLTWDDLDAGVELLDRSSLESPTVLKEGIYCVSASVYASEVLTVGGHFQLVLHLDQLGFDAISEVMSNAENGVIETLAGISSTFYVPQGGAVGISVINYDGTATRTFHIREVMVQRLL